MNTRHSVHPELVEGLPFFSAIKGQRQGFDKLSPYGVSQ